MFGRKKTPAIKVTPIIPRMMSLEGQIASLAEQVRQDHEGNVRICADLIAIKSKLDKGAEMLLDQAAMHAAELDFASKQISKIIECLQGVEEQEPAPIKSNGGIVESEIEVNPMQPIGFLKDRDHDVAE